MALAPFSPANPNFTFGCDPEVFIRDNKGKIIPACGLIPGTKEEPYKVEGGSVQVDGMAAEFGIDPASNFDEFNDRIVLVMKQLKEMLPSGYGLAIEPVAHFDPEDFEKAPDEAKALGCDPDFNAWTNEPNDPPDPVQFVYTRTASGHLHFGWDKDLELDNPQHLMNCRDFVQQLDWYLAGWAISKEGAAGAERRKMYGRAGAHRVKPYGVEYRVLSNFWLTSKANRVAVWNRMQRAVDDMRRAFMPSRVPEIYNKLLVESINSCKTDQTLRDDVRYPIYSIAM